MPNKEIAIARGRQQPNLADLVVIEALRDRAVFAAFPISPTVLDHLIGIKVEVSNLDCRLAFFERSLSKLAF